MLRARRVTSAAALLLVTTAIAGVSLHPPAGSTATAAGLPGHVQVVPGMVAVSGAVHGTAPGASSGTGQVHPRIPHTIPRSVSVTPLVRSRVQPNIVVIMADDARDDDIRFMPNVRHLIGDHGVRFVNMFSPQPLCCPARASFVTGEYTHNHHVWSHAYPYGFRALRDGSTLPVWLKEAGYNTIFLGKYLNGYGAEKTRQGKPSVRYIPPGWTDWRASVDGGIPKKSPLNGGTYRYFNTTLNVNGVLQSNQGHYQTRVFGHIAQRIFQQYTRSAKPFFTWLSFVAPHHGTPHEVDDPPPTLRRDGHIQKFHNPARPLDVRGRFDSVIKHAPGYRGEQDVSDKPFYIRDLPKLRPLERKAVLEDTRQRAEALSVLDDEVKVMMETLRRTGQLKNTYVMFTSDNGFFLGEHRMRQGKILPYEPSLRVPLLIRGPGIPAGQIRTDPFTMIDFAPTFLQMAGAAPRSSVDGLGLLGIAKHGDRGWKRGILTETGPRAVSGDISESDNFLVKKHGPSPLRFSQGVRTRNYLYVESASRERELYDLRTDPAENINVVNRKSERAVVAALAHQLDLLRNCKGSVQCAPPLPRILR